MFKTFFSILITLTISSCVSDSKVLRLGKGNDVIVELDIVEKKGISKIEFRTGGGIVEEVNSEQLKTYGIIYFGFNGTGEGTFEVCIYSSNDTICSEQYVEGGYRPRLSCTKDQIIAKNQDYM